MDEGDKLKMEDYQGDFGHDVDDATQLEMGKMERDMGVLRC